VRLDLGLLFAFAAVVVFMVLVSVLFVQALLNTPPVSPEAVALSVMYVLVVVLCLVILLLIVDFLLAEYHVLALLGTSGGRRGTSAPFP